MANYQYIVDDPLETRPRYDYAEATDDTLLNAWRESRQETLSRLGGAQEASDRRSATPSPPPSYGWQSTDALIADLRAALTEPAEFDDDRQHTLDLLVQRFEAGKRIYAYLDEDGRSVRKSDYRNLERYVGFGEVLLLAWMHSAHLPYLNALLKLNDLLSAYTSSLPVQLRTRFAHLIRGEMAAIGQIDLREGPCE